MTGSTGTDSPGNRPATDFAWADDAWVGARVVVLGLGRFGGGLGVVRWLRRRGADVLVTDLADATTLGEAAQEAESLGARLVLGGHDGVEVERADLLVVNPAVPLSAPLVLRAREAGVAITSEIALVLERWPGPVIGVTGSNGKSTTVTLAKTLLASAGIPVVCGGNLGGSLLDQLEEKPSDDTVAVLELSSFMLEALAAFGSKAGGAGPLGPDVGVILNITPNHLDRHGDMDSYSKAKAAILARARVAVLNADDDRVARAARDFGGERRWFGGPGAGEGVGAGVVPHLCVTESGDLADENRAVVLASSAIPLVGRANRLDLAAALLATQGLWPPSGDLSPQAGTDGVWTGSKPGIDGASTAKSPEGGQDRFGVVGALATYEPPPHRLQLVGTWLGVRWIDDSVSTTPESTAASIEALGERCVLIAGGHDKGLDPGPMVTAARGHTSMVLTIGEEGAALARVLTEAGVAAEAVGTVASAVRRSVELALSGGAGGAVLLSPGYSSHDQYRDFTVRGHDFARCAQDLASSAAASDG